MVTIKLTFLTGRWHATPWGRQVNEGAVEWPFSPWRILRALLAVWHHKCHDVSDDQMRRLIAALSPLPSFYLPPAAQGHTRHYMPVANNNKTKIFDMFITIAPQDAVVVVWPDVDLDDSSRQLLARLLGAMTYFGRAESWVCAKLVDAWDGTPNATPANGSAVNGRTERVRLLATSADDEYGSWRTDNLQTQLDRKLNEKQQKAVAKGKDPDKVKLSKKEQTSIESGFPETIFDALHAETGELRKAGWSRPPGSRWVDYLRPADAFASKQRGSRRRSRPGNPNRCPVCGLRKRTATAYRGSLDRRTCSDIRNVALSVRRKAARGTEGCECLRGLFRETGRRLLYCGRSPPRTLPL